MTIILNTTQRTITLNNDCTPLELTNNGREVTISRQGTPGPPGPAGVGVPAGGTESQALRKASGTDYDTEWAYTWRQLVMESETNGTATAITGGNVYTYTYLPIGTIYRFVTTATKAPTNPSPVEAAFYGTFDGTTLGDLIATRGD